MLRERTKRLLGKGWMAVLLTMTILTGLFAQENKAKSSGPDAKEFVLANKSIARTISWADGRLMTKSLENRLAGKAYSLSGDEFVIKVDGMNEPVTAGTAKAAEGKIEEISNGRRLVVSLSDPALEGVKIRVVYELRDADFFGRKWIELDPPAGKSLPVEFVCVEALKFQTKMKTIRLGNDDPAHPVFLDDCFFGVEWPKGRYAFDGNSVLSCCYWPVWNVTAGFRSKPAIWGAAPEGEVGHWFIEKYIPSIRISRPKPILVYNSYYDISRPRSAADYDKTITGFRDNLTKKHGVTLDSFVVDDGWQNRQSIYECRVANLFEELKKKVEGELPGCRLGLWLPIGGGPNNGNLDLEWGRQNGYELVAAQNPFGYCLLGKKYAENLKPRLAGLINDTGINYFKHDFNHFSCEVSGHDHRIGHGGPPYGSWPEQWGPSTASQVEGMFQWMQYMKKINPSVFLNYTTGMTLNPWWLMGCDCVWFGGDDNGLDGLGPNRERDTTCRDRRMNYDFIQKRCQFPPNAIMTCGIIKGNYCFGWKDRPLGEWEHNVLMHFGRGLMMWELYITPDLLSDGEWAFLAKTIQWARANADVIAHSTRFLLGNVNRLEPYGYAHAKGDRCILFLRNPGPSLMEIGPQWKLLRLSDTAAVPGDFAKPSFDDSQWENTSLPGEPEDRGLYPETRLAYRCRFRAPSEWKDKHLSLYFVCAYGDTCAVRLNDAPVGEHCPSWSRHSHTFDFDVSKTLRPGEDNLLAIMVTTSKKRKAGLTGPVLTGPMDPENERRKVSFTLDPKTCGFDPKYKRARIKWVYPEGRNDPSELETNRPWDFEMRMFDVFVLDLTLKE